MLVNHSQITLDEICKADGSPLWGERAMYDRIVKDCENSPLTWHMFYDVSMPLSVNGKNGIQIDFFLICPKGIILIEVKGGEIFIKDGNYINSDKNGQRVLPKSPFQQVEEYKWALINNNVVNPREVFISTICAFPFSHLYKTNENPALDKADHLWNADLHALSSRSFADFCIDIIEADREKRRWYREDLSVKEMELLKNKFAPTIDNHRFKRSNSLQEILEWLKIKDLDILEGLSKNARLFIEGGPGTGKTTIAKAYIKKYSPQRGLFLCWNALLSATTRDALRKEGLSCCDVEKFESFLIRISGGRIHAEDFAYGHRPDSSLVRKVLHEYKNSIDYQDYSYIIIDEIHDTLDKGAIEILDELTSIHDNGLTNGRYLVFFDNNQGYREADRDLNALSDQISQNAAIFSLTENHRVPENKVIVNISHEVLDESSYEDFQKSLTSIPEQEGFPIEVVHLNNDSELLKAIIQQTIDIQDNNAGNRFVLLTTSNVNKIVWNDMTFQDIISSQIPGIVTLSEDNVCDDLAHSLPWTSVLRFKGLERENVIIATKNDALFDCFEMYIGMTRAISRLQILTVD